MKLADKYKAGLLGPGTQTIGGSKTFTDAAVFSVNSSTDALRITQAGSGNALVVEDSANPDSSPFVIDTAGLVVCGFTQNIDGYQIQSHNGNPISGFRWVASSGGATVALKKSRSTTINSFSIVSSGDTIGSYEFFGDDGAAFQSAARISAAVDAAPAAGSMPGRLTFLTTPTSSTTPSERMRIDSVGFVGINKTSPTSQLHLGATAGVADSGTIGLDEKDTTPANPASGTACKIYMKADKFIIQYNDAGTVRYKYLDLTGTGVTWVATTTAP